MDIEQNRFNRRVQKNSCLQCFCNTISLLRFIPFVGITSFYIWGLCIYFYYVLILFYESVPLILLALLGFLPLYTLSLWCYFKTVFAKHREIPPEFYIPDCIDVNSTNEAEVNKNLELIIQSRNLPIATRSFGGYVRYCRKCMVFKPDRAHHCTPCGRCISKMDHHCHWVSNCVAYDNYKYFIQFLSYTVMLTIYTVLTSLKLFLKFWKDETFPGKFQVFFLIVFCFIFSMSITFLLSYHIYLVLKNTTTLEAYQPPRFKIFEYDRMKYDLGPKKNFISVFGDSTLLWFFPVFTSLGDGFQFQLPLLPAQLDKSITCANGEAADNNTDVPPAHSIV